MTVSRSQMFWMLTALLLLVIIVVSGTIAWSRYSGSQPIEISVSPGWELLGKIHVGGAVNNPGSYPLATRDSIVDIIQAAGGITSDADLRQIELCILEAGEVSQPQKIDINRAELWLLEVLPGVGETKAEAIIDYRCQNGPFQNINELIDVEGIGPNTYERIKTFVTVAD